MQVRDELVYIIQLENLQEVKRLYDQLISIPHKHRKKEAKDLIEHLSHHIENNGGFEDE